MKYRTQGKYLRINRNNPDVQSVCDRTGFTVLHKDLRPQYKIVGNGKVNTGLLVHKDFVDNLNYQQLAPKPYLDPFPVPNLRPIDLSVTQAPLSLTIDVSDGGTFTITPDQLQYVEITFEGNPLVETKIIIPGLFKSYILTNLVPTQSNIYIEIVNNSTSRLPLKQNTITYVTCTGTNLIVTNTEKRD